MSETGCIEGEVLPLPAVERVARIMGPSSAAAQALACRSRGDHGTDALIVRLLGSGSLLVVRREHVVLHDAEARPVPAGARETDPRPEGADKPKGDVT